MLINERIQLIIKANGLSSSEFADRIGVKRSNLSHVLSGRNKPGLEFLSKVIESFPNVNASWLVTGEQRTGEFEASKEPAAEERSVQTRETIAPSSSEDSDIEKIVIFYSDGTFSVRLPSVQ